jgi:hypothetical protein
LSHRTLGAGARFPSALGKGGRLSGSACDALPLQADKASARPRMKYQRDTHERLTHRGVPIEMRGCATLEWLISWSIPRGRASAGPVNGDVVSVHQPRSNGTEIGEGLLALLPLRP